MDIAKKYISLWNGWPVRAARIVIAQGAQPVWRRVVGSSLTEEEVIRRRTEMPLNKALLGAAVLQEGKKKQDTELLDLGQAMVAKAVADAEDRPNDLTTHEAVTSVATLLPLGEVGGNPFVDPIVADKVSGVLGTSPPDVSSQETS